MRSIIKKAFNLVRYYFLKMKYKEVLVLGDSHSQVFECYELCRNFKSNFNVVRVSGATISGLDNPNSKTKAAPIFEKAINNSKANKVIVMLGEVDCGFVIWYRAEKYKKSVDDMFQVTLENYKKFLIDLTAKFNEVICVSAPLPTITDGTPMGEVANLRKSINANQLERTKLTMKLNSSVEKFSSENNVKYINLDSQSVSSSGIVKRELINKDTTDHHYDLETHLKLIKRNLDF